MYQELLKEKLELSTRENGPCVIRHTKEFQKIKMSYFENF